jgi:hypothetical protein
MVVHLVKPHTEIHAFVEIIMIYILLGYGGVLTVRIWQIMLKPMLVICFVRCLK